MALVRKTVYLAAALALVVGLMPATALAGDETHTFWSDEAPRGFPLEIDADVATPAPVVIKVEVPSSSSVVNVHIETSVIDGRFLGFTAGDCRIRNLPESNVPISAAVFAVADGVGGTAAALEHLDVTLSSDRTVHLKEGANQNDVVVDSLDPNSEALIGIGVAARHEGAPIPDGHYATSATIKVAAA